MKILLVIAAISLCVLIVWRDFRCLSGGGKIIMHANKTYGCKQTTGDITK